MQPNDQQGSGVPPQPRPVQPVPAQPQPQQPVQQQRQPLQPIAGAVPVQPVDPNALQAALSEPAAVPTVAQPVAEQLDEAYEPADEQDSEAVTWVAHEYIHQEKGAMWFLIFAIIVVALIAVSIFLMQSWSFAILMAVIAVVVVVYSRRPPRELTYSLNDEGLTIDDKLHKFSDFKSFGIIRDGEDFSVMLIPTQRFQPGVTVYFPEESGEAIVDMLGARLPMKDLHLDAVDRVVRLLRL